MFLVNEAVLVSEAGVLVNETGVLVNEAGLYHASPFLVNFANRFNLFRLMNQKDPPKMPMYSPSYGDGKSLWVCYNKIPIYPIFHLLKRDCSQCMALGCLSC